MIDRFSKAMPITHVKAAPKSQKRKTVHSSKPDEEPAVDLTRRVLADLKATNINSEDELIQQTAYLVTRELLGELSATDAQFKRISAKVELALVESDSKPLAQLVEEALQSLKS